jgi:hypothetical protein
VTAHTFRESTAKWQCYAVTDPNWQCSLPDLSWILAHMTPHIFLHGAMLIHDRHIILLFFSFVICQQNMKAIIAVCLASKSCHMHIIFVTFYNIHISTMWSSSFEWSRYMTNRQLWLWLFHALCYLVHSPQAVTFNTAFFFCTRREWLCFKHVELLQPCW